MTDTLNKSAEFRWEYKIVQPVQKGFSVFRQTPQKIRAHQEAELNALGEQGWECYQISTAVLPHTFYLKRRVPVKGQSQGDDHA